MGPVAARTDARDVAELIVRIHLREFFGGERLAGLGGVDVEAHGALVHRLDDVVAIRVEDVEETEVVDGAAVLVDLKDHVADRVDALAVGTAVVGRGDAQEVVAVLGRVHGVREVGVADGQAAVEDLAAHQVVLGVALAVAEGEEAVVGLMEAHHDAGLVDVLGIVDRRDEHVPADVARRVDHGVLRIVDPLKRAAHRVVPGRACDVAARRQEVVDEVEAVLEFGRNLLHFGLEHGVVLGGRAVRLSVDPGRVDAVDFVFDAGFLRAVDERVRHLDRVVVVGIEAEDRDARMGAQLNIAHVVLDFGAAVLGNDADRGILELVAAVADDGRERRDLVRVRDDFADLALDGVLDVRAGAAARGGGGARKNAGGGNGRGGELQCEGLHEETPLDPWSGR